MSTKELAENFRWAGNQPGDERQARHAVGPRVADDLSGADCSAAREERSSPEQQKLPRRPSRQSSSFAENRWRRLKRFRRQSGNRFREPSMEMNSARSEIGSRKKAIPATSADMNSEKMTVAPPEEQLYAHLDAQKNVRSADAQKELPELPSSGRSAIQKSWRCLS